MPYPYKKMTEEDFAYIRSVTSEDRVWVGDEIAREFYRDEMPEYGVFPPELYVEVENRDEVSAIMKYAYENNIPVVCRGAGTGLAGGATCKYGGIMLSVMRMNRIFPVDHKNQTITCEPGALLLDVQAAAAAEGLFYPPDPGEKTASIGGNVITNAGGMKAVRYGLTRDFVRCIEAVLPDGSIMNFSSNVVKNTTGYDIKDLVIGSEGTLCILTQVTLKLLPAPTCSCTLVMPFSSLEECADPNDIIVNRPNSKNPIPYAGDYAVRDTSFEVRKVRAEGISVLGVFAGEEQDLQAERRIFGKDFAYIRNIMNFSSVVGLYLKRQLDDTAQ